MSQRSRNLFNAVVVLGVIGLVGSVAWYREATATPPEQLVGQSEDLPMMLDLGGKTCPDCKAMAPVLEELRQEYAGRAIIRFVDVFEHPRMGAMYDVKITPTQVFFDAEGNEVTRHVGLMTRAEIVETLAELGVR